MTPEQRTALIRIWCHANTDTVGAAQLKRLERAGLIREVKGRGWYLTRKGMEVLRNEDGNG